MTNIIEILSTANEKSLVLLDELGSGTDPAEGMGLAVAILEELLNKKCLFVATTHYPEIKEFAKTSPGLINARMSFDRQSLLPLYRLEIGEAGESCALFIAQRLGLSQMIIERARTAAYGSKMHVDFPVDEASDNSPASKALFIENASNPMDKALNILAQEKLKSYDSTIPAAARRCARFNIGDSVLVYPQKAIGIVYQKSDEKGMIGVQLKKQKLHINHKRLKLHVAASELYPENYDFSIIFDSVATRKARHDMERKHEPGLMIEIGDQ